MISDGVNNIMYTGGYTQTSFISSTYSISGIPALLTSSDINTLCYKPVTPTKSMNTKTISKYFTYILATKTAYSTPDTVATSSATIPASIKTGSLLYPTKNFCPYYSGMTAYPSSLTYKCYLTQGT